MKKVSFAPMKANSKVSLASMKSSKGVKVMKTAMKRRSPSTVTYPAKLSMKQLTKEQLTSMTLQQKLDWWKNQNDMSKPLQLDHGQQKQLASKFDLAQKKKDLPPD